MARGIAMVAVQFPWRAKDHAFHNLDLIYGGEAPDTREKKRIVRKLVENLIVQFFEFVGIHKIKKKNVFRQFEVHNRAALDQALAEGKGALAVTAHLGNWEGLARVGKVLGYDIGVIIGRQWNPITDRWLRWIRESRGQVACYYRDTDLLTHAISHLKRNGILAVMADELEYRKPFYTPFFGCDFPAPTGIALLHLRYGAPILFFFCFKDGNKKYGIEIDGPYHFGGSGHYEEDRRVVIRFVYDRLEKEIKKHPDQWFNLFRSLPEGPVN